MQTNDLQVVPTSQALSGRVLDLVVTGSIAAIESVRFARALRRLGADVHVWLSHGGSQFITPMALEWASANPVRTDFAGTASHLAERDACIVAPASANFLRKLAQGITDSPTSALAASYLGAKKPVFILPNMHQSLADSPAVAQNIGTVSKWSTMLTARAEEGKQKFPDPRTLADQVAHHVNTKNKSVMVAFGGTTAYLDDVRFIANYSSGALGSLVCEELYRRGYEVHAIQGQVQVKPRVYSTLREAPTYEKMHDESIATCKQGVDGIVFMPSVLDYVPERKLSGKIRSGQENLEVRLTSTAKILPKLLGRSKAKVGFKLESSSNSVTPSSAADNYMQANKLSMFVYNLLQDVSPTAHQAIVFKSPTQSQPVSGKPALAKVIADHICELV